MKMSQNVIVMEGPTTKNPLHILDPATPGHIKSAEDGTTHETLIFNDEKRTN